MNIPLSSHDSSFVARLRRWLTALTLLTSLPMAAAAQCSWVQGLGFDLTSSTVPSSSVHAMVVLPNGDLIAAGLFDSIGGVAANNIARWNGASWSPLGVGTNGQVSELAIAPNGDVIAGGTFSLAGGNPASRIARWNGAWAPLGAGLTVPPSALVVRGNGDVLVGSSLATIARWDGSTWSTFATVSGGSVSSLLVLSNGDVLAGGSFTHVGGVAAVSIARWSAATATWSPVGSSTAFSTGSLTIPIVYALAEMPNGRLVAGGHSLGTATNALAIWDGSAWTFHMSSAVYCYALAVRSQDHVLAYASFFGGGYIYDWDTTGGAPTVIGAPGAALSLSVGSLAVRPSGDYFASGPFSSISGTDSRGIARRGCGLGAATAEVYGDGCYDRICTFYEGFGLSGWGDLNQSAVQFAWNGLAYTVSAVAVTPVFTTPTSSALPLTDDSVSAPISLPFSVPYPGGSTSQIVVGSNGYVFLQPSSAASAYYSDIPGLLNGAPRLAAMWGDHDPVTGTGSGTIHCDVDAVGQVATVTWMAVQQWNQPANVSTFQIAIYATGNVEYRYLNCASTITVLTGWSPGGGARDPGSTDVSALVALVCATDLYPLTHATSTRPVCGATVQLQTADLPAGSLLGGTILGLTQFFPGIDLGLIGMPGCALYASLDVLDLTVPSASSFGYALAIPSSVSLVGTTVLTQGIAHAPWGNPFGMTTSNGLRLVVGDY